MKKIFIKDLKLKKDRHYEVLPEDTSLEKLACDLSDDHRLHGVFLVDSKEKLVGVLDRRNLLDWTRMQLGIRIREEQFQVGTIRKLVFAAKAVDLCDPLSRDAAVTPENTLADALDKMAQFNLVDIPVLDSEGKVISDLSISEILSYVMRNQ